MNSYLSNRHYQKMTQALPSHFQKDQPKFVYMPSYSCQNQIVQPNKNILKNSRDSPQKSNVRFLGGNNRKLKTAFSINANIVQHKTQDVCPICQSSNNIEVKYYGKKHVCIQCRKLLRDQKGNLVKIFLSEKYDIICLGIKSKRGQLQEGRVYYYADYTELQIDGKKAYATFAGEEELVILLKTHKI